MNPSAELLTIQKFIYLLDDFHYKRFKTHLEKTNASLPLKLAETIRKRLPHFDSPDQLCVKIYKNAGKTEKQNFNQLSSYTFKLSANLANNYPEYLHPNIQKVQWLISQQKLDEANFLTARLLEIAERINDFPCRIFSLKILWQQAHMAKDGYRTQKLSIQLEEAVENQNLFYKIQSVLRIAVQSATSPKTAKELEVLQKYFEKYFNHPCASIRIFSQFAHHQVIYDLTPEMFSSKDNEKINRLRKEINNSPFLVFPFLVDIKGSLLFGLLNSPYSNVFAAETEKDYSELFDHYDSILSWKNYLNIGELHLIAVKSTKLLSLYHYKVHLTDYQKIIEPADKALMHDLIDKCRKMIARINDENSNAFEERSVRMLYSALLILSGGQHINEGLIELESLLTTYQQVNFKRATDSIFLCLMVGYFSIRDYEKCALTFKRYLKSIKGKLLFDGNNIKINSYYYLAQWLSTGSKQYPAKLKTILDQNGKDGSQRTIWELIRYFKLPITNPSGIVAELK